VNEERLWAPWRLEYVTGSESPGLPLPKPSCWLPEADTACFLCQAAATYDSAAVDRKLLVVDRGPHVVVVLNRYPYNNGHLLIAPSRHVGELAAMTRDEHSECSELLGSFTQLYRELLRAEGFNIGLNLGRVAGAGLPGHLHWHLVPRWAGDNNFMPVLAGTRVIPQSLDALWDLIASALDPKRQSTG
jgi:ATP adenylyltransferase